VRGEKKVNFEEMMREMEAFQRRMMETISSDFEELEKIFETGDVQGEWRVEPIERPGLKGFIARGFFSTPRPLKPPEILPPLKPPINELREALYDVDEGEDKLNLYIELPGVEEDEIETKAEPKSLEVKAGSFQAKIDLSKWIIDIDQMTTKYRNGVLSVTIPKIKTKEHLI